MMAGHWTAEQLMAHLYDAGPQDGHIDDCAECGGRLAAMREARAAVEALDGADGAASFDFLAAQRRRIYERMAEPAHWFTIRRWAPALATLLVLAGGVFVYEQRQPAPPNAASTLTDTQLVEDVGAMASSSEPAAAAPLQALFEQE